MGSYEKDEKCGEHFCDFHPNGYLKNYGKINLEDRSYVNESSYEFGEDGSAVRLLPDDDMDSFGTWGNVKLIHSEVDNTPITMLYSEGLESNEVKLPKLDGAEESKGEMLECIFPKRLCNNEAVVYYDTEHKLKFTGNFSNGKFEGAGKLYEENEARTYEGNFKEDLQDNEGVSYYLSGKKLHEGLYKEGLYSSTGMSYAEETQNLIFEGDYEVGIYKTGKLNYDSKIDGVEIPTLRYEGDFNGKGEFEGTKGVEYYENSKKKYEGRFRQGFASTQSTRSTKEVIEKIGLHE